MKKAIDFRIPSLIRQSAAEHERSMFIIVGDKARNQLPNLHYLMMLANMKMNKLILWAYKKELLGFTSHRKKREKKIKQEVKKGVRQANDKDPFEAFVTNQNIRYVYYKETEKVLGQTFGMCILQDFEALTPNLLARTIETVEGGGIIVLMLKLMQLLKQLYAMNMDVHARFRTESHADVVARFNERFLLSLASCRTCLVVDDELNVLPVSGGKNIKRTPELDVDDSEKTSELATLTLSLEGIEPAHALVSLAKTVNQAQAVLTFIDLISEKTLKDTVALTAGRGRGKSAALGIAIAAAIAHGYSNIFVTSPSPENLKTLFAFVVKAFDAMGYSDGSDYSIIQSTNPDFHDAVVRIDVNRLHRQTVQYILPTDHQVLGQAELVVVDEAAAIPLPHVQKLLGNYLVFMASTINGYEGTGRSLSLKLVQKLREDTSGMRRLKEIELSEPIRYAPGDPVEKWLNTLLCLDASPKQSFARGTPHPSACELYYVDRDTLFLYHPVLEAFLHRVMGLYVASHYKNSPNDLQLISDLPSQMLFVLLPPSEGGKVPEPLCVVQLALEGQISRESVRRSLGRGTRAGGDLIPWVVSQQFQDEEFAGLSGGRVVRIATSPEYSGMGYGSRTLELLKEYFEGKFADILEEQIVPTVKTVEIDSNATLRTEKIAPRESKSLPPLLLRLSQKPPPFLHYLGVLYGLTKQLHKFWARHGYKPVYLRQTPNELTGEHTCVMLHVLEGRNDKWLDEFSADFRARFTELLSFGFRNFGLVHALQVLGNPTTKETLDKKKLDALFTPWDLKRFQAYANNMLDYHVILDLVPRVALLYFSGHLEGKASLLSVQLVILLGIGLQRKSVEDVSGELNLPVSQGLAMFAKVVKKMANVFSEIVREGVLEELGVKEIVEEEEEVAEGELGEVDDEINKELEEEGKKVLSEMNETQRELIQSLDLGKYAIGDVEWDEDEAKKGAKGEKRVVSLKRKGGESGEKAEDILAEEMKRVKRGKKKLKKLKK